MTCAFRLLVVALFLTLGSQAVAAAKETVTIEFKTKGEEITHKAAGFARVGLKEPPEAMLGQLKPVFLRQPALDSPAKYGALHVFPRARGVNATVQVLLSEGIKFDGKFPGENRKWDKWDKAVDELVHKARSGGMRVQWEVWSEPNSTRSWKGSREDYLVLWYRTVKRIKSIDPQAIVVGPSVGPFDGGWIGSYLKVCKEYEVLPDIIAWHEKDPKGDVVGHVNEIENTLWQDGHGLRPIIVYQTVPNDHRYSPGFAAWTVAGQERSNALFGLRNRSSESGVQLTSLLTPKFEPRAPWWVYREYAQMGGRMVKVSKSGTVDALATWEEGTKTLHLLVGRGRRYVPSTRAGWVGVAKFPIASLTGAIESVWDKFEATGVPDEIRKFEVVAYRRVLVAKSLANAAAGPTTRPADELGEVELKLTHLPSAQVHVIARRLGYSGDKASAGPQKAFEREMPVSDKKEAKFILPNMAEADAYLVTVGGL